MIYLDHHATTPVAGEVLEAMLPFFSQSYGNAGSMTHAVGRKAADAVSDATHKIAALLGGGPSDLVFTSGATESCNLAILGSCLHPRQKRRKIVSLQTEHPAVLDPIKRLQKQGFEVALLPVQAGTGLVAMDRLAEAISDETALCSIMLANNEIGTIQPIAEIAKVCRKHNCLLHTDATQSVGRLPTDMLELGVDLLSFSAHKFYGPKGIGGLLLGRNRPVRMNAQIVGGGQQANRRSGTLNVPGIVGMSAALELWHTQNMVEAGGIPKWRSIAQLRSLLWEQLQQCSCQVDLNGPHFAEAGQQDAGELLRLPGNLNCSFFGLEGQSLMQLMPELAVSSGSACTSASPDVSHVLQAIGCSEDRARSSLRIGIGTQTSAAEIQHASGMILAAVQELQAMR